MGRRFSLLAALLSAFFLFSIVLVRADAEGMSIPAMLTSAKSLNHAASCVASSAGTLAIGKAWASGSCSGTACASQTASDFNNIFTAKDWNCVSFDEANRRCVSWQGVSEECGRGTESAFSCTSWRNGACVYWTGTCSGAGATASLWSCSSWNGPVCSSWSASLSSGCGVPESATCTAWNGDYCSAWSNSLSSTGCGGVGSWSCTGFDDLCAGISCPNHCDGSTFLYAGACDFGACVYSSAVCDYGCSSSGCNPSPYNIYGIALAAPQENLSLFAGDSFELSCTPSTGGALNGVNLSFRFSQDSVNWTDIPLGSGSIYGNGANPVPDALNDSSYSLTVVPAAPGSYELKCFLANSSAEISSGIVSVIASPSPTPTPVPPTPSPPPEQTPPPEQPPSQGSGGGFSGGFGGGFGGGGGAKKPSPSPTPIPVTPSPTPSPSAPAPIIDIRVPLQFEEGVQLIVVFVNGKRASGLLEINGPDARVYERRLEADGSLEFFFGTPGFWTIRFGNETVSVKVFEKISGNASAAANAGEAARGSPFVGLSVFGLAPEYLGLLTVFLFVLAFVSNKYFFAVLRVRKISEDGKTEIIVSNRAADLSEIVLTDFVGGEASVSGFSEEPHSVKETISGSVLQWRKSFLEKGGEWRVAYRVSGNAARSPAEFEGIAGDGKRFRASS